jgi:serine/threonine protein kinase
MASESPLIGQVIKGYELRDRLGTGGFGEVYRAYQAAIKREVAIKIIQAHYANRPDFIRRFETEAQVVARLEHPHIVPLYDFWREPDGAFLVMRWLRGGTLRDSLRAETWRLKAVVRLCKQISAALQIAHRMGVVHQDLKPANILLDEQQNAYLSDFGIAKGGRALLGEEGGDEAEYDGFVGSPFYSAPEVINNLGASPAADQYCLAIVLFELLSGQHPYEAHKSSSLAMLNAHLNLQPTRLAALRPDLPGEVGEVLEQAFSKKPSDRFSDIESFQAAFLRGLNAESRPIALEGLHLRPTRPLDLSDTHPPIEDHTQDNTAVLPTGVNPDLPNPYRGLQAFQEADAALFFGREALRAQLLERLQAGRFLALVGPSGSGKSSVIRAGVLPALRRGALPGSEKWFYVGLTPNQHPLEELEAGLLRVAINPPPSLLEQLNADERGLVRAIKRILPDEPGAALCLFIDQFEEVFTQARSAEREHFLNLLSTALNDSATPFHLMLTLRADFYDRPLLHPQFGQLIRGGTEVVLALTPAELEAAIVQPAASVMVALEPGLLAALLADVGAEGGALPLLQYTLTELFDRRAGMQLRLSDYEALGGVLGALAKRAEEVYSALGEGWQAAARQLFLRLVTLGEGAADTRRRVLVADLEALDPDKMPFLLDSFGRARLLTFDRDPASRQATAEVAHEALLRQWGRLRAWIDDSRADIRQERRLGAWAAEWTGSGEDASFLLRGSRLEELEKWAGASSLFLSTEARAFIVASQAARESEAQAAQLAAQQQARLQALSRQRLRFLVGFFALAAIFGAGLSLFAFEQRSQAIFERGQAQDARQTSDANAALIQTQGAESAARAQALQSLAISSTAQQLAESGDSDLALALALQAAQNPNAPAEVFQILADLAARPGTRARLLAPEGALGLAFLPTGEAWLSLEAGSLTRWDWAGERLGVYEVPPAAAMALSFDGALALTWHPGNGEAIVWGTGVWDERARLLTDIPAGLAITALAVGPRSLALGAEDGRLWVYAWPGGDLLFSSADFLGQVGDLAYSADGGVLLAGSWDNSLLLWQAGGEPQRIILETGQVQALALAPDASRLAYNTAAGDLLYVSRQPLRLLRVMQGHQGGVLDLAMRPDGQALLSGDAAGALIWWDLESGNPAGRLTIPGGDIRGIGLSADGARAFTWGGGEVRLWDLERATLPPGEDIGALLDWIAQNRYIRALSCEEQTRYLLLETCITEGS